MQALYAKLLEKKSFIFLLLIFEVKIVHRKEKSNFIDIFFLILQYTGLWMTCMINYKMNLITCISIKDVVLVKFHTVSSVSFSLISVR